MAQTIDAYIEEQLELDRETCLALRALIDAHLAKAESKIWHRHPVWFLDGNPIVGFSKLKDGVRVLFWSGRSFETPGLVPEGTFKAAEVRYRHPADIDAAGLAAWLREAESIQWDYKNIVKRRGKLERLL
jgi:hypothetical protein